MTALAILGLGCTDGSPSDDSGVTASTPLAEVDDAVPLTGDDDCAGGALALDTPVRGSLPGGWSADLAAWLNDGQVACTPFPSDFPGPYSVSRIAIPPDSAWTVAARPDPGVDLTLTAWFQSTDDGCYPERDIGTPRCESASRAPAGGAEQVDLSATINGFDVVILVGLAPGSDGGGYKLEVRATNP